jgi:hypothetical protein
VNGQACEDLPALAVEAALDMMCLVQSKEDNPGSVSTSVLSNKRKFVRELMTIVDKALAEGQKWVLVESGIDPQTARSRNDGRLAAVQDIVHQALLCGRSHYHSWQSVLQTQNYEVLTGWTTGGQKGWPSKRRFAYSIAKDPEVDEEQLATYLSILPARRAMGW